MLRLIRPDYWMPWLVWESDHEVPFFNLLNNCRSPYKHTVTFQPIFNWKIPNWYFTRLIIFDFPFQEITFPGLRYYFCSLTKPLYFHYILNYTSKALKGMSELKELNHIKRLIKWTNAINLRRAPKLDVGIMTELGWVYFRRTTFLYSLIFLLHNNCYEFSIKGDRLCQTAVAIPDSYLLNWCFINII